jgi:hypothetical protein
MPITESLSLPPLASTRSASVPDAVWVKVPSIEWVMPEPG